MKPRRDEPCPNRPALPACVVVFFLSLSGVTATIGACASTTPTSGSAPRERRAPQDPASVAVGDRHSCVTRHGRVFCWGANDHGQLGDGTTTAHATPHPVVGVAQVARLAAAGDYTCALSTSGVVSCWGELKTRDNESLEEIDKRWTRAIPVRPLPRVVRIGVGIAHACALSDQGRVFCWGHNAFGQLGDGTQRSSLSPVSPATRERFTDLAVGATCSCARDLNGDWHCWGRRPDEYGLMHSKEAGSDSLRPVRVPKLRGQGVSIAQHVCAADPRGKIRCTGVPEFSIGRIRSLSTGGPHKGPTVCAVNDDGDVRCAGHNPDGQAGTSMPAVLAKDVDVSELRGATSLALGREHGCAIVRNGDIWCWGSNSDGQRGVGYVGQVDVRPRSVVFDAPSRPPIDLTACVEDGMHLCGLEEFGASVRLCYCRYSRQTGNPTEARCWGIDPSKAVALPVNAAATAPAISNADPPYPDVRLGTGGVVVCATLGACHALRVTRPNELLRWGDSNSRIDAAVTADRKYVTVGRVRERTRTLVDEVGHVARVDAETYDLTTGRRVARFELPYPLPLEFSSAPLLHGAGGMLEVRYDGVVVGVELRNPRTGALIRSLSYPLRRVDTREGAWVYATGEGTTAWLREDGALIREAQAGPPLRGTWTVDHAGTALVVAHREVVLASDTLVRFYEAHTGAPRGEVRVPWCRPARN